MIKLKRGLALKAVRSVTQKEELVEIFFQPKAHIPPKAIPKWQQLFGSAITFLPSRFGDGLRIKTADPVLEVIQKAMLGLE